MIQKNLFSNSSGMRPQNLKIDFFESFSGIFYIRISAPRRSILLVGNVLKNIQSDSVLLDVLKNITPRRRVVPYVCHEYGNYAHIYFISSYLYKGNIRFFGISKSNILFTLIPTTTVRMEPERFFFCFF